MSSEIIKVDDIQSRIFMIRGMQVMLDSDLAELYGVETKVLNQAVKRNKERFPERFHFQISNKEFAALRSQTVTLEEDVLNSDGSSQNRKGKHRKYLPYAFTEQGVAMLSSVLKSKTAIDVSISIMDAFVKMRRFISSNALIFQRLSTVEMKQIETDNKIEKVLIAIESKDLPPKARNNVRRSKFRRI